MIRTPKHNWHSRTTGHNIRYLARLSALYAEISANNHREFLSTWDSPTSWLKYVKHGEVKYEALPESAIGALAANAHEPVGSTTNLLRGVLHEQRSSLDLVHINVQARRESRPVVKSSQVFWEHFWDSTWPAER